MKKVLLLTGVIYLISLLIFRMSFKYFRNFFPPTEITNYKIAGFSQYYGYPFYYDTFAFIILILLPAIIFLFVWYFRK